MSDNIIQLNEDLIKDSVKIFLKLYALEPATEQFIVWLILIHNVFNAAAYPFSGALSNGL